MPEPEIGGGAKLPRINHPWQLHSFLREILNHTLPRVPRIAGHSAPFDYLAHAFFENTPGPRDCVVWANRGGGKTQLGAIATILDVLYKPGIQVRMLAGSFDQASRMFEALRALLHEAHLAPLVEGSMTDRRIRFRNGSRVEALAQSERAVRGQRVHKVRCDEVEVIDDEIWRAVQMTTRSGVCGGIEVRGAVEAISTMHKPFGLMNDLIAEAAAGKRRLFRWGVIDVLERCPDSRACASCPLLADCAGRAKGSGGFFRIDDAIGQQSRTDPDTWASEMLCRRPSARDRVYPDFEVSTHVREFDPPVDACDSTSGAWVGGIDFGYRAPTVMLWAWHDSLRDILYVVDEHSQSDRIASEHMEAAARKPWPRPCWIAADASGNGVNDQTGASTVAMWKRAGWAMRCRQQRIEDGVVAVCRRIRRADGGIGLVVHPRCRNLVNALLMQHYPPDKSEARLPVKDGYDHACDALRYMVHRLDVRSGDLRWRKY